MFKTFRSFLKSESGATAIEYGLIAALVALVGVVAFTALGDTVSSTFNQMAAVLCDGAGGEFTAATAEAASSCTF